VALTGTLLTHQIQRIILGVPKVSGLFKIPARDVLEPTVGDDVLEKTVGEYVSSILKKKSDMSRGFDSSRHFTDGTSIIKLPKVPSNKAVDVVSAQKMVSTDIFHPARQNAGYVATVSGNKKVSKKQKNPFDDSPIINASYHEMVDEIVNELESSDKYKVSSKPEFKKAPAKNAKDLGLAEKSRSPEPSAISSISETKAKQSLKKRPSKPVPTAADAFDYLVDVFTGKGKSVNKDQTAPKVKHSLKSHIVRGIHDVNEIMGEVSKNPNRIRIKQQQEADIKGLRSANRHLKGSIAACANSKKGLTAGSLVKQHNLTTNTTTNTTNYTGSCSNPYGVTARYEKGLGDHRIELHYYYGHKRITHTQVERVLTKKQIHNLKEEAKNLILGRQTSNLANNASPATAQAYQTVNHTTLGNQGTKRTINRIKVATASGLARKTHSKVV